MASYLFNDTDTAKQAFLNRQTGQGDPGALPTEDLANLARNAESKFVETAPQGYHPSYQQTQLPPGIDPSQINKGWVEGFTQGRQLQQQDQQIDLANRGMGIKEEQQAMLRTTNEQDRAISDGMANAAQGGGFAGVIDYLTGVDPAKAMQFSMMKDKMDQSMMQTSVFKAALPNEFAKIKAEGYGILGKMGAGIMMAPPNEREAMYKSILPMVKTIVPDAPDNVIAAAPMFLLAASQATPENQLFRAGMEKQGMQTELGKSISDVHLAASKYGSNSAEVMALRSNIDALAKEKSLKNAETLGTLLQHAQKNNIDTETVLRKEVIDHTKEFTKMQEQYNKVQELKQTYAANLNLPEEKRANLGATDLALVYTFMKVLDPRAIVTNSDAANAQNAGGVPEAIRAQWNNLLGGGKLSDTARNEFLKTTTQLYEAQKQSYDKTQDTYKGLAKDMGLNPDHVILDMDSSSPMSKATDLINKQADAMMQKYSKSPKALQEIQAERAKQLDFLQKQQIDNDLKVDDLRKYYRR